MKFIQAAFIVWFTCASQVAVAEDANTMGMHVAHTTEALFFQKKFSSLNTMEEDFRTKQSRLPDGRWVLTFFYEKLGNVSKRGAENEWLYQLKLVDEWIKETPDHSAPYLVKAKIMHGYAWDARGGGYSYTVSNSEWKLFHERLSEASKLLEESAAITGKNPYWFYLMEIIAKEQSWPVGPFSKLYEAAIRNSPTYYQLHFRAADYFQPSWHGSPEALRNFVNYAVENSKKLEGMTLYARIYWTQIWTFGDKAFDEGYVDWKDMKQGFQDIMHDYPDSAWNLNAFAYYACMAEDWDTYSKLNKQIGARKNMNIWRTSSRIYTCDAMSNGEKIKKNERKEPEKHKETDVEKRLSI